MEKLHSLDKLKEFIDKKTLAMVYISSENCNVCHALLPKIEAMIEKYPQIEGKKISIDECTEIAGEFSIFTIPAILFYVEGKEVIRKARFISVEELEQNISRYYNMFI
ncbi:thioredoxin family protein [Clostridium ganghwense]|uniref:Thioredoxin family protein n=1 Tax=Clostridium ganghwense TaxID=312089 RepID=A0ABT4CWP1_9CLOT|nr:thioredoxin family protein [Clostridium ganghwense]MCY6372299.1 thioredoxin family protein [Clostridium ganghwense]